MFPTVIYNYDGKAALPIESCVIAIGFFDGVHIAHRDLIYKGREIADRLGIPLGVFTFPSENSLKPNVKRLYSTEERLGLLEKVGVDFTVLANFDSVSSMTPEEFVNVGLVGHMGCRVAVAGYNFRFGAKASGDAKRLSELMKANGGECEIIHELKEGDDTICTTLIRSCLASGEIEKANRLLGAAYRISSTVIHGKGLGRKLGFPTVNTDIEPWRVNLRQGVYRTALRVGDNIYTALTNIGVCPTFEDRNLHAETYIVDYSGDLYGEKIEIYLIEFMRDEIKFNSEKELTEQINKDKETAIKRNGETKWQELGLK